MTGEFNISGNSDHLRNLEKVLHRISIPRGQVTLLKALYEAEGKFVQKRELVERIRWGDSKSFTSVLAAFAGRINHTDGFEDEKPGYGAFIEVKEIDGEESFRLRPEARQAIERVKSLIETFEQPMKELLEGIEVEPKGMSPGGAEFSVTYNPWLPDTPEDQLLVSYWENVGGAIIAEVPTGSGGPSRWPNAAKNRRIDGIRFHCKGRDEIYPPTAYTTEQIKKIVKGRHVEVIEVKQSLNRNVIGQAVAGRDLFSRDYDPVSVEPVAVCGSDDPALSWVCRRNGIRVEIFEGVE